MMTPDLQRIKHIRDYCVAISMTINHYGNAFEIYASDADCGVPETVIKEGNYVEYVL